MKAIVTGASSGIGKDIAIELSKRGYDLILVSRNLKKLKQLKKEISTSVTLFSYDLSILENCYAFYEKVKEEDIDIFVNNAGFGLCGKFCDTSLSEEMNMIDLNIKAVHIFTKLFYQYFKKRGKGYILNVASSAAFLPGPLMSTYYASKAYVLHLSEALYEENRKDHGNVRISVLCPGPVDTHFNERANVAFSLKGLSSKYVARCAVYGMFAKKLIIIPSFRMKFICFMQKFIPKKLLLRITYKIQKRKLY